MKLTFKKDDKTKYVDSGDSLIIESLEAIGWSEDKPKPKKKKKVD